MFDADHHSVTDIVPFKTTALFSNTELAASIAWAETVLGVKYSVREILQLARTMTFKIPEPPLQFTQQAPESGASPYIVPWPVDLEYGTTARWLTDVVALHPACIWSKSNVSGSMDFRPNNISNTPLNVTQTIFLSDAGVDLKINPSYCTFSAFILLPNRKPHDLLIFTQQLPFLVHPSVCWMLNSTWQIIPTKHALVMAVLDGKVGLFSPQ